MKNRTSIARSATVVLTAGLLTGAGIAASAQTAPISATIAESAGGGRAIAYVSPVTLLDAGAFALDGTATVAITELTNVSSGNWSATLIVNELNNGTSTLALSGLTGAPQAPTNPLSDPNVTGTFPLPVAGTEGTAGASGSLGSAVTIFSVNQTANNVYSGLYLSDTDIDLSVPNGTATGAYVGTMTVTIVEA